MFRALGEFLRVPQAGQGRANEDQGPVRPDRCRQTLMQVSECALPQPLTGETLGEATDDIVITLPRATIKCPAPGMRMPYEAALWDQICPAYITRPDETSGLVRVTLPVYFRVEVFPPDGNTECILIATHNRLLNGRGDGVTAYGSVDRTDFGFRTQVFNGEPRQTRHFSRRRSPQLLQGQWNEMSMALSKRGAKYWINGQNVATALFRDWEVPPDELYVGVISYESTFQVRRFDVSRDPQVLQSICTEEELHIAAPLKEKIITVHPSPCGSSLSASSGGTDEVAVTCTSIAGEEVAVFESIASTLCLSAFREMLNLQVQVKEFEVTQLVLPDGSLLDAGLDKESLADAFHLSGNSPPK